MPEPANTLAAWRRAATERLSRYDAAAPAEAEIRWLIEHVLALTTTRLILAEPKPLAPGQYDALEAGLARRLSGVPLAQIIGRAVFGPLELIVTPDVLIPRADTEILVDTALNARAHDQPARVLDLGTGSGAIALMLARARPHWQITATDQSGAALACARDNAAALEIASITFVASDWFSALAGARFDLIVSNPPYIAEGDTHLAALTHEPRAALVAGPEGMTAIDTIVDGAPDHLMPGGWLFLEHGHTQGPAVRRCLRDQGFESVATLPDLAGRDRVTGGVHAG